MEAALYWAEVLEGAASAAAGASRMDAEVWKGVPSGKADFPPSSVQPVDHLPSASTLGTGPHPQADVATAGSLH